MTRAKAADTDQSFHAARALGGLPDPALLAQALERIFAPGMRLGNSLYLLQGIARNPEGRGVTWEWLTRNLREFERRAKGSPLLSLALQFTIPEVGAGRPTEVREYFGREEFPGAAVGIANGLELMEVMARVRARIPSLGAN